jgi:hypothetical protein
MRGSIGRMSTTAGDVFMPMRPIRQSRRYPAPRSARQSSARRLASAIVWPDQTPGLGVHTKIVSPRSSP